MRSARLTSLALVSSLALAACGGGGESSTETAAPSTDAAATTEAPSTSDDTTTTTLQFPPREEPVPLTPSSASAGPLTVTASVCSIDGINTGEGSADVDDFDITATHAFIPVENGAAALSFTAGAACSMTLDTAIGDGGILTIDDTPDGVSASSTGRVALSTVFGTTIFDVTNGQSYECSEPSGDVDIKDDGTEILSSWSGSPIERYTLSDTTCTLVGEVALPVDFTNWKFVAYDGSDVFLGAEDAAATTFASRVSNGTVQWKVGNAETSGQGWIGWVHGMAPCGSGYCIIDTNTDKLIVTDGAGVVRAEFAVSELIGSRLFYSQMRVGPDGALYVLATDSLDDGAGGRYRMIHVVRLEVVG